MITQIFSMVLPVLALIIIGRLCAAWGILNDERHAGLKDLIGSILLPVTLFNAFFTAEYSGKLLLVFVLVFLSCLAALGAGYALRRFVRPYDRFMPLLMTSFEGGMLGYALFGLLAGAGQTRTYAWWTSGRRCLPTPSSSPRSNPPGSGLFRRSPSARHVRGHLPHAGDRRSHVRKEPGRGRRALLHRTDAAWNPGGYRGHRRRDERGDPGGEDPGHIR